MFYGTYIQHYPGVLSYTGQTMSSSLKIGTNKSYHMDFKVTYIIFWNRLHFTWHSYFMTCTFIQGYISEVAIKKGHFHPIAIQKFQSRL